MKRMHLPLITCLRSALTPGALGIAAVAALLSVPVGAAAPATPAPAVAVSAAPKNYEGFRLVRSVNIFDPERRPGRTSEPRQVSNSRSSSRGNRNRSPYLALTGTMVTNGRALAFFVGSQEEYNKIISLHDKIGDFTITDITSTHVDLDRGGKPVTLVVGKQLPLDGSAITAFQPDAASADDDSSSAAPSDGSAAPSDTPKTEDGTPPAVSSPSGEKNDVLRRMMERRQKELAK